MKTKPAKAAGQPRLRYVQQLGNGLWRCNVPATRSKTGIRWVSEFATAEEASAHAAAYRELAEELERRGLHRLSTLQDAVDQFLEERKLRAPAPLLMRIAQSFQRPYSMPPWM